jgi:hypothetical protein
MTFMDLYALLYVALCVAIAFEKRLKYDYPVRRQDLSGQESGGEGRVFASLQFCWRRPRCLLLTLVLLDFLLPVRADDVAILWDISRSVPEQMYSPLVGNTVLALLGGRDLPEGWHVTVPSPAPPQLDRVLQGRGPMIAEGERILLVRFGALNRQSGVPHLPFSVTELQFSGPATEDQLRAAFPTHPSENWTNKMLVEAGAARYLCDAGSARFFLVLISDLNQDNQEALLPQENILVDSYRAGKFVTKTDPAILRLRSQDRVVIEIRHAEARQAARKREVPPPPPPPPARTLLPIAPVQNASLPEGNRVTFSWRWNGDEPADSFQLVVTHLDSRRTILSRATKASSVTSPAALEAGRYRWQVFALAKEQRFNTPAVPFEVQGGTRPVWVVAAVLLAAGGLVWWRNHHRSRRILKEK